MTEAFVKERKEIDEKGANVGKGYEFIKRTVDVVCSLGALILLSPIFLIVAIAIKLESKGPVLFSQERIWYYGKPFKMYKFRSMVANAEELKRKLAAENEMDGPMFKMKEDPRVTKVGKFIRKTSIDELPQIINILKGEMSLVVVKSTVPIGTNDRVEEFLKENVREGIHIEVASNPEFLSQGTAVKDTLEARRIVIGVESKYAENILREVYERYNQPIVVTNRRIFLIL